jgi:hypothetical protein
MTRRSSWGWVCLSGAGSSGGDGVDLVGREAGASLLRDKWSPISQPSRLNARPDAGRLDGIVRRSQQQGVSVQVVTVVQAQIVPRVGRTHDMTHDEGFPNTPGRLRGSSLMAGKINLGPEWNGDRSDR